VRIQAQRISEAICRISFQVPLNSGSVQPDLYSGNGAAKARSREPATNAARRQVSEPLQQILFRRAPRKFFRSRDTQFRATFTDGIPRPRDLTAEAPQSLSIALALFAIGVADRFIGCGRREILALMMSDRITGRLDRRSPDPRQSWSSHTGQSLPGKSEDSLNESSGRILLRAAQT